MNETGSLLERVGERFAFPEDTFERLEHRRDRRQRNRRIGAGVAGLLMLAALVLGLARATFTGTETRPGLTPSPTGGPSISTPTPEPEPSEPRSWPPSERISVDQSAGTYYVDVRTGRSTPMPDSITDIAADQVVFDWGMQFYQGSPDGSTVLFVGNDDGGRTQIYLSDVEGTNVRRLTDDPVGAQWPSWAPDGERIVYVAGGGAFDRGVSTQLTILDLSTGEQRVVADGLWGDFQWPRFTPDGSTILFTKLEEDLWSVPVAGGEVTRVLSNAIDASLAPDGTIAFERIVEACLANCHGGMSESQIWLADADGGNERVLGGVATSDARWSTDGARIAFSRAVRRNDETVNDLPVGSTGPGSDRPNGGTVIFEVATSRVATITGSLFPIGWLDADTLIVQVIR